MSLTDTDVRGLVAAQLEEHGVCPVREVLNRVGDKWSVGVVVLLGDGTQRFGQLQRSIEGISQRMLTLTLRGLERDGLVTRTVYATVPPKVEYDLTPLGLTLLEPISALFDWAYAHRREVTEARAAYDSAFEGARDSSQP